MIVRGFVWGKRISKRRCSRRLNGSWSTSDPQCVFVKRHIHDLIWISWRIRKYIPTTYMRYAHYKISTKHRREHACSGRINKSCFNSQSRLVTNWVISHERVQKTGLWLRETKHIRCYLWHTYSILSKHVAMATLTLSKRCLQFNH